MKQLDEYLKLYFAIEEKDLASVSTLFRIEQLKKGDFYLCEKKVCKTLSFIKSGYLRIYSTVEGKEITQWIATQNYFVTELNSFTFNTPARWNIQALTDTVLYTIRKEDYSQIQNTISNWEALEKQFIVHCFTTMENRIFQHLSQTAEERYHSFFDLNKELFNQIPLQYIASMLGMSPETLSRIRNKQTS